MLVKASQHALGGGAAVAKLAKIGYKSTTGIQIVHVKARLDESRDRYKC